LERVYLLGLVALHAYYTLGHTLVFGARMEFLPLLLTSVYCALGIVYTYAALYRHYLSDDGPDMRASDQNAKAD
jgi:alpha-1,3-glucosyltransferase